MVVFGQKWLYLDKVVPFRQSNCAGVKCLYSGNSGCNRAKWFYYGKSARVKWLYSGKMVVLG